MTSMKTLASKYALSELKARRASLAGEIATLRKKLAWAEDSLRHVDACLILMDPTVYPGSIPPKKEYKRIKLFRQGELSGRILAALREAGRPCSTKEIVERLIRHAKFDMDAEAGMAPRVRSNLSFLVSKGRVEKIGRGVNARWAVVRRDMAIQPEPQPVLRAAGNVPPALALVVLPPRNNRQGHS